MSHRTREHPASRLAELGLFAQCSPSQLRKIDRLCTAISVGAGRTLCTQNDIARECFVVVDGRALVRIDGRAVGVIERGELVGELALLTQRGRRAATVTAETDMTLLVLTRPEFSTIMVSLPRVAHVILREATRRLIGNANLATHLRPSRQRACSTVLSSRRENPPQC